MHIEPLLLSSHATDAFKHDVRAFATVGHAPRIAVLHRAPRIKVLRVLAQLLATEPALHVDSVRVHGVSGCADFVGTIAVHAGDAPPGPAERTFAFAWDCAWRARQAGWFDAFDFPDQIRAAREFEWRCFREWRELASSNDALPLAATG